MLLYEENVLKDTRKGSFVLVSGYGIHLNNIINLNVMLYLNKYSFTFLLNFDEQSIFFEHEYFRNLKNLDKQARKKLYQKGGVYLCSSRVLLTDFLEENISVKTISAVIINNADKIRENSVEAFILHIFRRHNSKGLIKAFSSNCIPFAYGVGSVEKYANTLKCNNFLLLPRFHKDLLVSYKENIKFIQHKFKLTDEMIELQMLLIEILKELIKLHNIDIDYELILVSRAYIAKHISDIYDIKYLIMLLFSCNLYRFYMECAKLIWKQIDLEKDSTWLNSTYTTILLDKIEIYFLENEQFVCDQQKEVLKSLNYFFKHKKIKREEKSKKEEECKKEEEGKKDEIFNLTFQKDYLYNTSLEKYNPKFERLVKLLTDTKNTTTLIILPSSTIHFDVENKLNENVKKNVMFFTKTDFVNSDLIFANDDVFKRFDDMNQELNNSKSSDEFYIFYNEKEKQNAVRNVHKDNKKGIYFEYGTNYQIILFDKDLACIRKCEYIGTQIEITVHSFQFKDSIEEQINLLSLRNEKLYFEQLINRRGNMPLLLDCNRNILEDGVSDENDRIFDIVVDTREIRADLPFFLYKAGNNIIIDTLQIGDYLISENVCVERKNINDFISSLNTGRLYNQTRMLTFYYQKAVVLLEFNSRPCLSDFYNHNSDTFRNSIISKFCLFLITFPTVNIIWSDSTLFTTKTFRKLQNRSTYEENDELKVGLDPVLQEILFSIPGINQFNLRKIIKNFKNIKEIVNSSRGKLQRILGQDMGYRVFRFFDESL